MNLKVTLNNDGFVRSYAFVGDIVGSFEAILDDNLYDDFVTNFTAYYLFDGVLLVDSEKTKVNKLEESKAHLRVLRKFECFPIVNRGKLWYDNLNENQLAELDTWYQAWLDVTETLIIPEKPAWLI